MSNRDDDAMSEEGPRNPLVDGATTGASAIRTVWERSGAAPSSSDAIQLPDFEVVRKGFSPGQVREYLTQLIGRVRNLERQLEDQRLSGEHVRALQQEFGDPQALIQRLEGLERELDDARMARDAARADSDTSHGAEDDHSGYAAQLEGEVTQLKGEVRRLQAELEARSPEAGVSGGPDAYEAIASQVSELIRSAGVHAEQIRREGAEEADRQLEEAREEAGSIRREAEADADTMRRDARIQAERLSTDREEVLRQARAEVEGIRLEAEAVRREAQQASERIGTEREEVLRDARQEADRVRGAADAEVKRQRDESQGILLKARSDAERMLGASISRRDLVRAEMEAMRQRLMGVIELLEPAGASSEPGSAHTEEEVEAQPGKDGNDRVIVLEEPETVGAGEGFED